MMMKIASVVVLASLFSTTVNGAFIGFNATLGREGTDNFNGPRFSITNDPSSSFDITSFDVTIGDASFNFDWAFNITEGGTGSTLVTPDLDGAGGIRDDRVTFTFTDFNPGETFEFSTDVDQDSINTVEDFRTVMFNNGGLPNSVVTVGFANGQSLQHTIPDMSNAAFGESYAFSESQSAVPEPSSAILLGFAAAVGGLAYRRRKEMLIQNKNA